MMWWIVGFLALCIAAGSVFVVVQKKKLRKKERIKTKDLVGDDIYPLW